MDRSIVTKFRWTRPFSQSRSRLLDLLVLVLVLVTTPGVGVHLTTTRLPTPGAYILQLEGAPFTSDP
jgi:hypothetical protein